MIVQHTSGALKVGLAGILLLLLVPLIPLVAKTKKGDKLRNDARAEELKGNYDHALELAEQAVKEDASDPAYLLEARRVRFEVILSWANLAVFLRHGSAGNQTHQRDDRAG